MTGAITITNTNQQLLTPPVVVELPKK